MLKINSFLKDAIIAEKAFLLEQLNRKIDINKLMNVSQASNEFVREFISTNTIEGDELSTELASQIISNEKVNDDELLKRWVGVKFAHQVIWSDKFSLQVEYIHEAHRALMRKVDTVGGIFKTKLNKVGSLYGALPNETPLLVNELLVDFLITSNQEGLNVFNISQFISTFLAIHPYEDGNGRISRLLFNRLSYDAGYKFVKYVSVSKFIYERKDEYIKSLEHRNKAHEEKNITVESIQPLVLFFLDILISCAKKALEYCQLKKYKQEEFNNAFLSIVSKDGLSYSEAFDSLKWANSKASIDKWLKELVDKNKVKRIGQNKSSKYII